MSEPLYPTQGGRAASMARRQAMSNGKAALPPPSDRTAAGKRDDTAPGGHPHAAPAADTPAPVSSSGADCGHASCRHAARQRRAEMSRRGRGDAPPAPPSRLPRRGQLDYAPKVAASPTQGGQSVTGPRFAGAAQVTGASRGQAQPISGAQYIAAVTAGAGWRPTAQKVGLAKTAAGNVVSGAMVRGRAAVTGDEASPTLMITGEADQRVEDDVTPRLADAGSVSAQFRRQADPHGLSTFGTNLGRSARAVGSRHRERTPALEASHAGLPITGSAVGRSVRVTGDEEGACRQITGSQYLTPASRQTHCGGPDQALPGQDRRDPVSGAKVRASRTWGGREVTGVDLEHDPKVTGDAPGTCAVITGSPYQGVSSAAGWCDADVADDAAARLTRQACARPVTGDTPTDANRVTGTARGAASLITGTPYYRPTPPTMDLPDRPVEAVDLGFSVGSPQRSAHLRSNPAGARRITGAFALGEDKITGNAEFHFQPRRGADPAQPKPRDRITGEGRTQGPAMTGGAWADQSNVTGTDGCFAADRNPSLRAGKAGACAGAAVFRPEAPREEAKQLVTGMFGFASKASARVTLSGGAQG